MNIKNIGILETGRPPEDLAARFGSYPQMVEHWLDLPEARYVSYAALDGQLPQSPDEVDLWVITGSKFGAYEDHPWIAPLEAFIRDCRDANALMFGICFGHQIIAQALGGTVTKSDKDWGLGVHEYQTTAPFATGEALALQAYHQDQVSTPPQGAQTVASSPFCEHAALWYEGFALTVQGHPEFSQSYAESLLRSRRGSILAEDVADKGIEQSRGTVTAKALAKMAIELLGSNVVR